MLTHVVEGPKKRGILFRTEEKLEKVQNCVRKLQICKAIHCGRLVTSHICLPVDLYMYIVPLLILTFYGLHLA